MSSKKPPHLAWLPNWRDEKQYPDPKKTPKAQWSWEFMRRNSEYIALWHELIEPYYDAKTKALSQSSEKIFEAKGVGLPAHLDPKLSKQALKLANTASDAIPQTIYLQLRFGIDFTPLCPSSNNYELFIPKTFNVVQRDVPLSFHKKDLPFSITAPIGKHEVLCWVDLERPLDPQLKRHKFFLNKLLIQHKAERGLKPISARNPKKQINLYRDYLRLLDGYALGAKTNELAKKIYPNLDNTHPEYAGTKRVTDNFARACELRDSDYLKILSV